MKYIRKIVTYRARVRMTIDGELADPILGHRNLINIIGIIIYNYKLTVYIIMFKPS